MSCWRKLFRRIHYMTRNIHLKRIIIPEICYFFLFLGQTVPNLNPPFRVIAETKGGTNPYFATGAGGILQSLLMGFGGLEITPKGLIQIKTDLPAHWKSLTLTGIGPEKKTYIVK